MSKVTAQCTIGDSLDTFDANTLLLGTRTNINNVINAGQFIALENMLVDVTYTFDVCGDAANTEITLFNSAKNSIEFRVIDKKP